jgi:hypothetical protein
MKSADPVQRAMAPSRNPRQVLLAPGIHRPVVARKGGAAQKQRRDTADDGRVLQPEQEAALTYPAMNCSSGTADCNDRYARPNCVYPLVSVMNSSGSICPTARNSAADWAIDGGLSKFSTTY